MCKVSIIIPVYNVEKYLSRSLDSVLSQTYKDIEVICINDGCTDNSAKILEQYQKFDDRIIIINTPHNTAAMTRNIGIDAASGKYTMFIDSDDYIASIMVEQMVEQIEKTQAEVLVTDYVSLNFRKDLHDDKYNRYFQSPIEGKFEGSVFIDTNDVRNYLWFTVTCWNKIYLTEFLKSKKLKFPAEFPIFEDWLFWVGVFFNTKKLYYYRKCYYYYRRRRKGSLMSKKDETVYWLIPLYQEARKIFKKNNKYEEMKDLLDYLMIRDFLKQIFLLEQPNKEEFFNLIKDLNYEVDYEKLKEHVFVEENKEYIKYYKTLMENTFEDFEEKTKDHVPLDA